MVRLRIATLLISLTTIVLLPISASMAKEQYPTKPIRIYTGYSPGGPADIIARTLAQGLGANLGQSVVVVNLSGAGGSLADGLVARAAPDGYSLLVQGTAISMNSALIPDLPFDPLKDLAPITLVGETQYLIVVNPSVPAKTLREFVELAKQKKGRMFYGAPSSPSILATTMLDSMAGIDLVRVPYRGAAPAITALVSGEVQMLISSIGPLLPFVRSGRVRALAVSGKSRTSLAPEVPTVEEAGIPGYSATTWYGLFAPAGAPRSIIDELSSRAHRVLADPDVKKRFLTQGFEVTPSTPEEFSEFMRTEAVKWTALVKEAGLGTTK